MCDGRPLSDSDFYVLSLLQNILYRKCTPRLVVSESIWTFSFCFTLLPRSNSHTHARAFLWWWGFGDVSIGSVKSDLSFTRVTRRPFPLIYVLFLYFCVIPLYCSVLLARLLFFQFNPCNFLTVSISLNIARFCFPGFILK